MADFDEQRRRMVGDLRRKGIRDRRVLEAMSVVPREAFVPLSRTLEAYDDRPLGIGGGQTISQPYIVAYTAQQLDLQPDDLVLDVGTGSGYAAAVLARLAGRVVSIERLPDLAERAARVLDDLGAGVEVVVGDGSLGWPEEAPYDAIAVAAAAPTVPPALLEQLAEGGRLVVPVGRDGGSQRLHRYVRRGDRIVDEPLIGVRFVPLVGEGANRPSGR